MSHTPTPSFFPSSLCYFCAWACSVCVCAHMCTCMCMCTHPHWFMEEDMCRDQREKPWCCLQKYHPRSLIGLEFTKLGKTVLPVRPQYIPVSTFPALGSWGYATTSGIFTQVLAIDRGPHVCRAHSLLTELSSLHPFFLILQFSLIFFFTRGLSNIQIKLTAKLDVVAQACNTTTQEEEARGSSWIWVQSGQHSEF